MKKVKNENAFEFLSDPRVVKLYNNYKNKQISKEQYLKEIKEIKENKTQE